MTNPIQHLHSKIIPGSLIRLRHMAYGFNGSHMAYGFNGTKMSQIDTGWGMVVWEEHTIFPPFYGIFVGASLDGDHLLCHVIKIGASKDGQPDITTFVSRSNFDVWNLHDRFEVISEPTD